MKLECTIGDHRYCVDMHTAHDISIPICFDDTQLAVFGHYSAHKSTYEADGFVGDVARGGSCNCEVLHITPHLNGTHTECVGHISQEALYISDLAPSELLPSTLITIDPVAAMDSPETYSADLRDNDLLISKQRLQDALKNTDIAFLHALIIRTLPNNDEKTHCNYNQYLPPFFSSEAMEYICTLGIQHLLVDMPSIDRLDDGGGLSNHRLFWNGEKSPSQKTVTELIYAPDTLADGHYMLNLHIAPIASDAAPSKPILYDIEAL